MAEGDPKVMQALQMVNDAIKESNVSGGLLNHLPFLRFIAPELSGYTAITERYNKMWSFFAVRSL